VHDLLKIFVEVFLIPGVVIGAVYLFTGGRSKPPSLPDGTCPRCHNDPNYVWYTSQGPLPCPRCHGRHTR
jgi:hypothetical protein